MTEAQKLKSVTCYLFHVVIDDHANMWVEGGKRIRSYSRSSSRERPQEGGLAGIGKTNLKETKVSLDTRFYFLQFMYDGESLTS